MKQPRIASIYPFPGNADYCHDVNFTLIDGDRIYSAEEAKFSTITNDYVSRYPERAMARGFQELDLTPDEIDFWIFGQPAHVDEDAQLKLFFQSFFGSEKFVDISAFQEFKNSKVIYVKHQIAHAALAVIASGFEDCSFLTLDGGGDAGDKTDSIFGSYTVQSGFKVLNADHKLQNGLGAFHTALTRTIGFSLMEDGKATGLASYGAVDDEIMSIMNKHLIYDEDFNRCIFHFNRSESGKPNFKKNKLDSYNRWKVWKSLAYRSDFSDSLIGFNTLDIARTGEELLVQNAIKIVDGLIRTTNKKDLALSGGVFQNVFLNSEIARLKSLTNVYVPMAPNDAGLSLGAALYFLDELRRKDPRINVPRCLSAFLGPEYSDREVKDEIQIWPVEYKQSINVSSEAAQSIAEGKVVGWFQGKQELGPRALGSRSVLGNPLHPDIKAKVNQVLKKRDWFMPYAPSCLFESSDEYFEESPMARFMSFALIPKVGRMPSEVLSNISHVDGTSRAQYVTKDENPKYHQLISDFSKVSGVSIVLNTSFNRHGIATISSPKQALEHLVCGNIEELYLGNYKITPISVHEVNQAPIVSEDVEILMISLKPYLDFFAGESHIPPKWSRTLEKYLTKLNLSIDYCYLVYDSQKIDLRGDNSGIRETLIKIIRN